MKIINIEVIATPLTFPRNVLRRAFITHQLFMDYAHPVESIAGFSVSSADFEMLCQLSIFMDVTGAFFGGDLREVTPGEEVLGCPKCPMRDTGQRPYLTPPKPEFQGQGFSNHYAVLCNGLMASNRSSDKEIPCLNLLKQGVTTELLFSHKEE